MNIVVDALKTYGDELKQEAAYAVESAKEGKWGQVWDVVKDNRGFVFGVVVPVLLILRFPPLIPWVL